MNYLLVGLGGFLGANARYILGGVFANLYPTSFPYETLAINVTGSLVLGFFMTLVTGRLDLPPEYRLLFAIGFVGSYTTFSTFTYETLALAEEGDWVFAALNVLANTVLGLLAAYVGITLAKYV